MKARPIWSDANGPARSDANGPARSDANGPARSDANGPVPSDLQPATGPRSLAPPVPRDRVVTELIASGRVSRADADRAGSVWRSALADGAREPFWRFLARQDGIDAEAVFRAAADVYGFLPVRISLVGTLALAHHLATAWPQGAFGRLVSAGAVPVIADGEAPASTEGFRLTLASHDPCGAELRRLADSVIVGPYDLRYATWLAVDECTRAIARHVRNLVPEGVVRMSADRPSIGVRRAA